MRGDEIDVVGSIDVIEQGRRFRLTVENTQTEPNEPPRYTSVIGEGNDKDGYESFITYGHYEDRETALEDFYFLTYPDTFFLRSVIWHALSCEGE